MLILVSHDQEQQSKIFREHPSPPFSPSTNSPLAAAPALLPKVDALLLKEGGALVLKAQENVSPSKEGSPDPKIHR